MTSRCAIKRDSTHSSRPPDLGSSWGNMESRILSVRVNDSYRARGTVNTTHRHPRANEDGTCGGKVIQERVPHLPTYTPACGARRAPGGIPAWYPMTPASRHD